MAVIPRLAAVEANCSVTPGGVPVMLTCTGELNPFTGVSVISEVVDSAPCAAVMVEGAAVSVKVAGETTVSVTVIVVDMLPLVPLIVIG